MKILAVKELAIPQVKVIRYQRFADKRGYFTEIYRKGDMEENPLTNFLKGVTFTQINESRSLKGVMKGLHFQWNPYMAKLVRTSRGKMTDLFLDIRKGSPTFGKIGAYEMSGRDEDETNEWIWIPVGFAHGNFYQEDTTIEYLCTGQWAPQTEAAISMFSSDIDWSLVDERIRNEFNELKNNNPLITDKDRDGYSLASWSATPESDNFIFTQQVFCS